jgi:hypothetical protein
MTMGGTRASFYSTMRSPAIVILARTTTRMGSLAICNRAMGAMDSSYLQRRRIDIILLHHLVQA